MPAVPSVVARLKCNANPFSERNNMTTSEIQSCPWPAAGKAALLEHFKKWSGGFAPEECTNVERRTYLESALPKDMSLNGAIAYFNDRLVARPGLADPAALRKQRDGLLAACRLLVRRLGGDLQPESLAEEAINQARAAIADCEEQA